MRIALLWIPVEQWQAAKRFYGELLGLVQTACDDGMGRATYSIDEGPALNLVRRPDRAGGPGGVVIMFESPNIEALKARLVQAGVRVDPHIQESRTTRVLTFYDPDGNCLEALQRVPLPPPPRGTVLNY